jgi:hypothetical protein
MSDHLIAQIPFLPMFSAWQHSSCQQGSTIGTCSSWLLLRYKVEAGPNGPGIKEWPMVIQDAVVDTPHAGDGPGVCRLKYDRLGEASAAACYLQLVATRRCRCC